jgi:hypothetical protein
LAGVTGHAAVAARLRRLAERSPTGSNACAQLPSNVGKGRLSPADLIVQPALLLLYVLKLFMCCTAPLANCLAARCCCSQYRRHGLLQQRIAGAWRTECSVRLSCQQRT